MSDSTNTTCTFGTDQQKVLKITGLVDEGLYGATLIFFGYNCFWLLYQKNRWHNEQIRLCYIFAGLVCLCRTLSLPLETYAVAFITTEMTSSYSQLCLGIC